jgi:hypothetical protein
MADKKPSTKAAKTAEAKSTSDQACGVAGCKRPYRAKGLCVTHYKLWRRGELEGRKARYKTCSKEGCRKPIAKGGLCLEHSGQGTGETAAPAA